MQKIKITVILFLMSVLTPCYAVTLNDHSKLRSIANELTDQGLYTHKELQSLFAKVKVQQSILDAMQNPAEYKFAWGKYRKIFMKDERINKGVDFWNEYEATLSRAAQEYGVPPHIIVAIIGVESKYGQYKGKHKVLQSLVTLVTGSPRRSDFFANELKDFLILSKENSLDAQTVLGSYAGAVGFPQFISSSYRNYAVDFSADGVTDLINQPVDAIGSVANYFNKNGWLAGQPVTSSAQTAVSAAVSNKENRKLAVQYSAKSLRTLGAQLPQSVDNKEQLNVLMLDANEELTNASDKAVYIVRGGDTVWRIARHYGVTPKQLAALNSLNKKRTIYRGQRLKIPQSGNGDEQSTAQQPLYFYTHENFYVITRYNHSVLYAMAVHELSQAIRNKKMSSEVNEKQND